MSYNNNNFLSYSFLKKLEKEPISKEKQDKIEKNLLYFFDILNNIPKEKFTIENKYQNIIYDEAVNEILFENTKYTNGIIEVYNNLNEKLIVLEFKKNITLLNEKFEKYQDLKVINYGKENNFKFAILTDGIIWRIYKLNTANYFETFIEINIESFIKTKEIDFSISLLDYFINQENLIINKETQKSILDIFLENSDLEINKIEKELKYKMEDILSGIGLGFKEAIGKENFTSEECKELYNDSITILYRTLFIIYAESKNLLPIEEEEYKSISFNKIIDDLEFEIENNNINLWEKMETLFSYIDNGYIGKNIEIEAYNGGLFNNKGRKYLGKCSISNKYLIKVLKKISFYEKGNKIIERIEFKDLSTRSFGTLYEGILDYNMFIASEDMLKRIDKKGTKVSYIPLNKITAKKTDIIIKKGEIYLSEDAFERKDTGAYYTPELIVEYITSNTIDTKLNEILNKNKELIEELDELKEKINQEYESFSKEALQEELYQKIILYIESQVLTISVLDNAMGSGHFLVNAAYHIASKIYSFIHKYIDYKVLEKEKKYEFSYWLRKVVTHNIYGVDINNLAVQLGKLSLWLISASKDKPLSFLDHHLKCGNSLLGTTRKEIDNTLGDNLDITKSKNRTLFDITINNLMLNIDLKFKKFEKMTENTAEEIHIKEKFYKEIQEELKLIKLKWDIYLAMQIENKKGIVKKEEFDKIVNLDIENISSNLEEWIKLIENKQFFHWELEFPQVFFKNEKGFDCIIGNPPYGAKIDQNIKKYFSNIFNSTKKHKDESKETKGSLDTFSLFIDKSLNLIKKESTFGYIVPLAVTSSDSMSSLHKLLKEKFSKLKVSTYSNRPKKIFPNADQRVCIIIGEATGEKIKKLYTTKVNKRYKNISIEKLVENLEYIDSLKFLKYGRIPKIGKRIEIDILDKLFNYNKNINDIFDEKGKKVYYRAAGGRYYNVVTTYPTYSSAEKDIIVLEKYQKLLGAILSSNLFYWFQQVYSDTLNLKRYEIEILPLPINNVINLEEKIKEIEELYLLYLEDIEKNAVEKNANYNNISKFKEYKLRKSKFLIDKLDEKIGQLYSLTDEEINFLINYDIEFRIDE